MKKIVIIGAGQLGSRHLQALAKLSFPVSISVVDASPESLGIAEARFKEVSAQFKGDISFFSAIADLPPKLDLVIMATGSKVRRMVVEQLLTHASVTYLILEKFLFTREEDYSFIAGLLETKGVQAWVNCPRRMMDFYKGLRNEISGRMNFFFSGNNWGMACNGIHLLDLFSFLTGNTEISLDTTLLDPVAHESKRPGYIEFTGSVTGHAGMNFFQMTSFDDKVSGTQLTIHTPTAKYSIEEGPNAKAWISRMENGWAWEEIHFRMPFQSELTTSLAEELLASGSCPLTSFEESSKLHVIYLRSLLQFLRKANNDNSISECLIT